MDKIGHIGEVGFVGQVSRGIVALLTAHTPALTGSAAGAFYDIQDTSTLYSDRAGTTAASVDGPVGRVASVLNRDYDAVAPSDAKRPLLRYSGGRYYLEHDDLDDKLVVPALGAVGACTRVVVTGGTALFADGQSIAAGTNYELPRLDLEGFAIVGGVFDSALRDTFLSHFSATDGDDWDFIGTVINSSSVNLRHDTTGAVDWEVDWGDGSPVTGASAATLTKNYGSATTGYVASRSSAAITRFDSTAGNLSANLADLQSGLTYYYHAGDNTVSGSLSDLPAGLTYYFHTGYNTVSGSLADLPSGLTDYFQTGSNTVNGSLADLPSGVTYYYHDGLNTVSGSLSDLPSGVTFYLHAGSNTVTIGGSVWRTASMDYVRLDGALTSGEVDSLLINLADVTSWIGYKAIALQYGGNAARTSASDAAVTTIEGLGATVTTA